jgi:hypothetical protein
MRALRAECAKQPPEQYGECLVMRMPGAGASPAAVAFTDELKKRTGQVGFVRGFRNVGRVDIAYIDYPLRANENQGWLLVNGNPPMIDVDDLSALPKTKLEADAAYVVLAKQYPSVALFPGDRAMGNTQPKVQTLANGGQRFIVRYRLVNGCHACARLGSAAFAFDFDRNGQFAGPQLLRVEPAKASARERKGPFTSHTARWSAEHRAPAIEGLPVSHATSDELRPFRHHGQRIRPFWQESPKRRMMPTEVMATAVPVRANTLSQFLYLIDELLTSHLIKVSIHDVASSEFCLTVRSARHGIA